MAIAAVAARSSGVAAAAGATVTQTPGAIVAAGRQLVVFVTYNRATSNTTVTVTDQVGNTYVEAPVSFGSGNARIHMFVCNVTTQLASTTVITATLGDSAVVDKSIASYEYSVASGFKLAHASTNTVAVNPAANGFGSVAISGLSSLSRLYVRTGVKIVSSTATITATTNFTSWGLAIRSRNNANAVVPRAEHRINTSTGETSNPTFAVSGVAASIIWALEEVSAVTYGQMVGSSTLGISGSATGKLFLAGQGSSTFSYAGSATAKGTGKLAANGSLSVTSGTTSLKGAGKLAASGSLGLTQSGALKGTATAQGASSLVLASSGTVVGLLAATGASSLALSPAGTIKGLGRLGASLALSLAPTGALKGAGRVQGSAPFDLIGTASLQLGANVQGATSLTVTAQGTLRGQSASQGSSSLSTAASASLKGSARAVGGESLSLSASASLKGTGGASATASLSVAPIATLRGQGNVQGATSAVFFAQGQVGSGAMQGTTSVACSAAGSIKGSGRLGGALSLGITAPDQQLKGNGRLGGQSPIAFVPSPALLKGAAAVVGAAALALATAGTLAGVGGAQGSAPIVLDASGTLTNLNVIPGEIAGTALLSLTAVASLWLQGFGVFVNLRPAARLTITHRPQGAIAFPKIAPAARIVMSHLSLYDVGDVVEATIETRVNRTGALADPATMVVKVANVDTGSATRVFTYGVDPELVRDGVGQFRLLLPVVEAGHHVIECTTTGAVQARQPFSFDARAPLLG